MSKKKGNLLEQYIDKAVLGIVGILCLCLLWMFVIGSPYAEEYNGQKFGPGEIDSQIKRQAASLRKKLDKPPVAKVYDKNKSDQFISKMACTIEGISNDVCFPIPDHYGKITVADRKYLVPVMPDVSDASAEAIRTVVHVPIEEINLERHYNEVETELKDIDLVTVEVSFDVAELYKNFKQSFTGKKVKRDWHDTNLAKPVFANVDLQRRQLVGDDSWSEWEKVSRPKIDHLTSLLDIPQKVDEVKYSVDLLVVQLEEFEVQQNILQPDPYDFAASNEEWFTPALHKEYLELRKSEEETLRREEREKEKEQKGRDRQDRRSRSTQSRRGDEDGMGMMPGMGTGGMGMGLGGGRSTGRGGGTSQRGRTGRSGTSRRGNDPRGRKDGSRDSRRGAVGRGEKERTLDDVNKDFEKLMLTEDINLDKMRDLLIVWAHDDTTKSGESYQYRLRVGVFNPIAGKDWFREDQKQFKNKVVLWSNYSESTEIVTIPEMTHFFPLDVDKKEEKTVKIQVSKFHLGQWRSKAFKVCPGEVIGKVVEEEPEEENIWRGDDLDEKEPEIIDYSTGIVLVDVVKASDWTGEYGLRQRDYMDVLYTADGVNIEHLAVKNRNWPDNLQEQFIKIKDIESEIVTVHYDRRRRRDRRRTTTRPEMMPGMMPGMMPMGPEGMMPPY